MKTLLLLDGVAGLEAAVADLRRTYADAEAAVWDHGSVPEGLISIPVELDRRLLPIRAELLAWVYETGKAHIGINTLEEHLRAGDSLSMWWCSTLAEKHPKVTHNLFEAMKLRALELVIEERDIRQVVLFTPEKRPQANPHARPGALADVLARFCAATGRQFTLRAAPGPQPEARFSFTREGVRESLKWLYHRLPAPVKAAGRFPAWWWRIRRLLPHTRLARPAVQKPATIVTYFPNIDMTAAREGRFRSRYWESLHDALKPAPGQPHQVNWVFVHFPAPQYTFAETVALRDRFRAEGQDGASFHFLEEFLTTPDLLRAWAHYARLLVSGLRVEKSVRSLFFFPGSKMDLWPYLRENWADSTRGWRALERCLMRLAFRRYAAWAGPQAWVTFPQENCPWERMLTDSMRAIGGGPVYGAQHSTVRPTDFRYFDDPRLISDPSCARAMPHWWLCNGTGARDALRAASFPEDRMRVVEALRYLYLAPANGAEGEEPQKAAHESKRLLVVTSFFEDEVDAHLNTLAAAARNGALAGWEVLVKPHPYVPVQERLGRLFPEGGALAAPPVADGPIGNFLTPGTVVWASNSTTVALEAAYKALPVLVQAAENDVNLCPLQGLPGVVEIRTAADVAAALSDPKAPALPPDYLALDPALPRWREVLKLQ